MKFQTNLSKMAAAFLLPLLAASCGTSKPTSPVDGGTRTGGTTGTRTGGTTGTGTGGATGTGTGGATGTGTGGTTGTGTGGRTGGTTGTGTGGATGTGTGGATGTGGMSDAGANDTGTGVAGDPVNLRTAGTFVILAKTGISTVPASVITGNLGVSPAAAAAITNFSLIADSTNVFSTSAQVTGRVYASDYAVPTPSNLTTAVSNMETAFTDAAGRAPSVTELGAGNIGGMTLPGGVYKWGTGLLIPSNITLNGSSTAVWIFQIAQDLTVNSGTSIMLTGGAVAKNVFWQVAGGVIIDTTAHFEGVILSQTSIVMRTGSSIRGRLLAQSAVTLDTSTVMEPAP